MTTTETETKEVTPDPVPGVGSISRHKSIHEIIQREVGDLGIIVNTTTKEVVKDDGTVETVTHNEFVGFKEGYATVHKFFATTECWFPGCDELRKQYNAAVSALGDESCVPCKKGAITRQFVPKVKAALDAHLATGGTHPDTIKYKILAPTIYASESATTDKDNKNTGTVEVPGPRGKGIKGTGTFQQLLRRASNGIKKIFRAGKTKGENSK